MATVAEVQDVLGRNGGSPKIIRNVDDATFRQNYVLGATERPGKARWVTTTIANSAATQAAAILAALVP